MTTSTVSIALQLKIQEKVQQCLDIILRGDTARNFKIVVEFKDNMKTTAGLAYVQEQRIVLNEPLFMKNQEHFFSVTIPHEVAHILQYVLYPNEKLSHGRRWKEIMVKLGLKPAEFHNMDCSEVDNSVYRYTCSCNGGFRYHQVLKRMHDSIQAGRVRICGTCNTRIIYFPRGDQ